MDKRKREKPIMKTLTKLLATRLASSLAILLALFAAQSAWADKDKFWTGASDNYWRTSGNWVDSSGTKGNLIFGGTAPGTQEFNSRFTTGDDAYTVRFATTESSGWKVHIRSGTEAKPIVFEADSAENGLTVGSTGNNTGYYVGYDDSVNNEAWLMLKRGTWGTHANGYWFVGNGSSSTGHVVVCDGAIVACSNDFKLSCGSLAINDGGTMTANQIYIGNYSGATGTMIVNGGRVTNNTGALYVGYASGSTGNLYLNGGTLVTRNLYEETGTGTVVFNGGALKAKESYSNYGGLIGNTLTVQVGALGGTIDNGGFDVIVGAALGVSGDTGGMKFTGSGKTTLNGDVVYTGGTTVEAGMELAVTSADNVAAILGHGLTVNASSVVPTDTVVFSTTDGTISVAQLANCTVTGTHADKFDLALGADEMSIVLKNIYVWNGGTDGTKAWGEDNVWLMNSVDATWSDGGVANFNTDGAQANLAADAEAAKVNFQQNATVSGSRVLTVSEVSVDPSVSATISAPTAGALTKTGEGTLTLGSTREGTTTTLSEGTLVANAPVGTLTLGTDPTKPVTFDYGGQIYSSTYTLNDGLAVTLTNCTFSSFSRVADGTVHVAKDATAFINDWLTIGPSTELSDTAALLDICGGAVSNDTKNIGIGDHGALGSSAEVRVRNGGLFATSNGILIGSRAAATLTIDDGTVDVQYDIRFCDSSDVVSGEDSFLNLNAGGLLTARSITYGSGTANATFTFNGGTLKANQDRSPFIQNHDRLFVTVNAAGGTIDNNGKTITINADLLGAGDMTFTGSGKTTIGGWQTGTGALNVNAGTVAVDGGVTVARPTTVANGATFTVNATSQATVNTLTLEAGSTLNIASYSGTVVPLSVATLTLPDSDTASLTLDGGAFPVGIYKILDKHGITVAEVQDKFVPSTGGETYSYSVSNDTLVLTVGTPVHGRWIASAGGDFSEPWNWSDGQVPQAGDSLNFSGVTANITINCGDLSGTSFAGVTLPTAKVQVTINGTLRIASMTVVADSRNFSVASGSKLIVDGDVELSSEENKGIRYIVFENKGMVEIGGKVITSGKPMGYPCYNCSNSATITVKGIVSGSSGDHFKLNAFTSTTKTSKWIIGGDGLRNESGKKEFWLDKNISAGAELKAAEDFAINSTIGARRVLTLDTDDGKTITVNGEIYTAPEGTAVNTLTVKGSGSVKICNTLARPSGEAAFTGDVIVTNTATLAINAGKQVTTGEITVNTNATLQVAESGTVTLGGNLTLKAGAKLGFNFTDRATVPQLNLTDKTVTFDEGAATNVVVKISAADGVWPSSGRMVLTSGSKFADVNNVTLDSDKPRWAKSVGVNDEGNIYVEVKPKGLMILVL